MNITRALAVGVYTTSIVNPEGYCMSRSLSSFRGFIRPADSSPVVFSLVWHRRGNLPFTEEGVLKATSGNAALKLYTLKAHCWKGLP